MNEEEIELAGVIFTRKEMSQLPKKIADGIMENMGDFILMIGQSYMRNQCHNNSILATNEIKYKNAEVKIVEGLVKCDNEFLFEHFWNSLAYGEESSDFDVTLDVIGSEEELRTKKTYYEYRTYSLLEIEERKRNTPNAFSLEIDHAISDYYNQHPELKERYDCSREKIG